MNYFSQFSVQYLLKAKTDGIIDRKVIALGGINLDRINFVIDYGFGGIGVLGFLWEHYNYNDIWGITNKFLSLKNKIEI
ncbi:hypothetical protein SDC9_186419 [bioreactor metagenome]|uniref:Thiamine-phosphate synthase n=1 Tax=bioreactor metagenome TaxID=1076179 RepID=A0A645HRY2_9ZZZZ